MATKQTNETHHPDGQRRLPSVGLWTWIVAMALAKSADVLTTIVGLKLGYVERNPLTLIFIDALGPIVGVATVASSSLVAIVFVVEVLRECLCRLSISEFFYRSSRTVGYTSMISIGVLAAVWNISVIGGLV